MQTSKNCPTSRQIINHLEGTADPGVSMEVDAHLENCDYCARIAKTSENSAKPNLSKTA